MIRKITLIVICLIGTIANSQITITGNVFDEYLEPFSGAIINSEYGNTTSNFDGEFTLNVNSLPVTLKISSVGYSNELLL